MNIRENISLQSFQTFGVDVSARFFITIEDVSQLKQVLSDREFQQTPKLILGGGSNILFKDNYEGLVIYNNLKGINIIKENAKHIWVKVSSGENWHQFVEYCLDHDYGGVENLSLIPGRVGAAPIQNIGAYGVELKDVFESLKAVSVANGESVTFNRSDCEFGYRQSIFKGRLKGDYCITAITLRLDKEHTYQVSYGSLQSKLQEMGVEDLSIQAISRAVCNIRRRKLPDPQQLGNAGSFFTNPYIKASTFKNLKKQFPSLQGYPSDNDLVKIPAGWLIEQCGYKGIKRGNVGTYKNQALIIVNYGGATSQEILALAEEIQETVYQKFRIWLEPEVNII